MINRSDALRSKSYHEELSTAKREQNVKLCLEKLKENRENYANCKRKLYLSTSMEFESAAELSLIARDIYDSYYCDDVSLDEEDEVLHDIEVYLNQLYLEELAYQFVNSETEQESQYEPALDQDQDINKDELLCPCCQLQAMSNDISVLRCFHCDLVIDMSSRTVEDIRARLVHQYASHADYCRKYHAEQQISLPAPYLPCSTLRFERDARLTASCSVCDYHALLL